MALPTIQCAATSSAQPCQLLTGTATGLQSGACRVHAGTGTICANCHGGANKLSHHACLCSLSCLALKRRMLCLYPSPPTSIPLQAVDDHKPLYDDSQMKAMDEQYGKATGPESQETFDMDKLGDNANSQGGGWTMSDEYDAPLEEYGEDRPDADKVSPCKISGSGKQRKVDTASLDIGPKPQNRTLGKPGLPARR